jgi:hypothetical protein
MTIMPSPLNCTTLPPCWRAASETTAVSRLMVEKTSAAPRAWESPV